MTTQDPELSAALGWPGGISDPVLDRKTLLQMVAALRLASQQALEALEYENSWHESFKVRPYASTIDAITALRAALAQQAEPLNLRDPAVQKRLAAQWGYVPAAQAEPVEPVHEHEDWCASVTQLLLCDPPRKAPCNCKHTAPPQRKPLTEKEIERIGMKHVTLREVIRAVERAHGIGEQS